MCQALRSHTTLNGVLRSSAWLLLRSTRVSAAAPPLRTMSQRDPCERRMAIRICCLAKRRRIHVQRPNDSILAILSISWPSKSLPVNSIVCSWSPVLFSSMVSRAQGSYNSAASLTRIPMTFSASKALSHNSTSDRQQSKAPSAAWKKKLDTSSTGMTD